MLESFPLAETLKMVLQGSGECAEVSWRLLGLSMPGWMLVIFSGFALFGLVVLAYVIGRFFVEGGSVPGFPFLASTISIFSGVQLFALGIIGEYLARMHFRLMERPTYVVREHVESDKERHEHRD